MEFYRRKLPHWQISGAEYFITIRLAGSLPVHVVKELQQIRRQISMKQLSQKNSVEDENFKNRIASKLFQKYEKYLDEGNTGPTWLNQVEVAKIVADSIHFRDGNDYDLYAYCIMSNHVHLVFRHLKKSKKKSCISRLLPVTRIMKNLKSYTGLQANKILNRKGSFWQDESFDRLIRNETELENVIRYTIYNPVKAYLVKGWKDWSYTYCKKDFLEGV